MRAVYPGTFDPFTKGHLDVVRRGLRLFGALTVAVARGGRKRTLFPLATRLRLIRESVRGLRGVRVEGFSGALVDYLESARASTILRGPSTRPPTPAWSKRSRPWAGTFPPS
jgi:pantetheine-phosphate adenylyltransferase